MTTLHGGRVGPGQQLPRRRQSVEAGHPDVHQDDVRAEPPRLGERLQTVDRRPDDGEVGLGVQDHPQPGAHQLLVVDDQHPDRHPAIASTASRARTR